MQAVQSPFLPFLEGKKQFIIPIYQRTYSWTREQCEQLWNDIARAATDEEVRSHFIGSIVYIQHGMRNIAHIPQYLVIDGQQRLTTLSLLLIALAKAAKDASATSSVESDDIYESYLINKFSKDEHRYKLLLTQSDKDTLMQLIDDPELARTRIQAANRLLENFLFFENRIRQSGMDLSTLYSGISKLIIVDISLDRDHDNPQLIFESLNSTGMDLSQADLIRNYVLMGLDTDEQAQLYKKYWYPMEQSFRQTDGSNSFDRFMRDYLTMKLGSIPNVDEVYSSFKSYQHSKSKMTMQEIVADIDRFARYFVIMAHLWESDREIKRILHDINTLKVDVAYPFLLEVYDDYANGRLSREDFIAILKLVESYVFRRVICGLPTNSMNKTFATLAKEIDKQHYLESVQAAFLSMDSYRRFPRDEEFRAAFVIKDVYNFRSRNYLLRKLENFQRKEWVTVEEYTIEHVMPQNEHLSALWQQELGPKWRETHARYLHTIGNLTLTGYNSELSDRPFQEKRDMKGGFATSPLRLNERLALLEHWNEDEINRRAQALADLAITIWAIPNLSPAQTARYSKPAARLSVAEIIGPVEHPQAGFIPEGFKVVQLAEKKFYYYRLVEGRWVQYGNGKTPWYAVSWETVGRWLRDFEKKSTIPLGVGGEIHPLYAKSNSRVALAEYNDLIDMDENGVYTLDSYPFLQGDIRELFERLRKRILNFDPEVREECKKLYIAYKTTTNFVDIEPQKSQLRLFLNMKFSEIADPWGYCRDVTNVGHHGNGDIEVTISSAEQLDDVMDLIHQSFEKHWEAIYA
ncbi:MAG TPA: DUF262 and DUF1524 domain-containing protein [Ktedonobacteraceae bacterium]|jgi:uncharacterized protein with ParB-like and HNH nuclease domain/predicted transport protein|nr:DUF262 and DUF1524 domain-containing protein [Ktedonobacteraceae bacterium]